jgi:hypothetical protein
MAEGASSLKGEFLGAVASFESGLVEFGHPLDQCSHTWCHLRLTLLVIDEWGEQKFVHPPRLDMHIPQEPSFLRVLPRAFEGSINVFLTMRTANR